MENDEFSFFPGGVDEGQDSVEAQKLVENINGINLENKMKNGVDSGQGKLGNDDTMQKQGKVGFLSFTVTDMSAVKKSNGSTSEIVVEDARVPVNVALGEKKISAKIAAPRKKVLFEKGYSQMDWMRLTRTHPDLAGLNGQSNRRLVTLNEVKQHQAEGSLWTVLKGRVYNVDPYMKFHPGGVDMLMKAVGKDCTSLFNKYHAWVNADILLEKCLVGIFDDSSK